MLIYYLYLELASLYFVFNIKIFLWKSTWPFLFVHYFIVALVTLLPLYNYNEYYLNLPCPLTFFILSWFFCVERTCVLTLLSHCFLWLCNQFHLQIHFYLGSICENLIWSISYRSLQQQGCSFLNFVPSFRFLKNWKWKYWF